jgi:hypothetical protein
VHGRSGLRESVVGGQQVDKPLALKRAPSRPALGPHPVGAHCARTLLDQLGVELLLACLTLLFRRTLRAALVSVNHFSHVGECSTSEPSQTFRRFV